MGSLRSFLICIAAWLCAAFGVWAQEGFTALARVDPDRSAVADDGTGLTLRLALSQPVPWRVFTLDAPRRLVLDFGEARWPPDLPLASRHVQSVRFGIVRPGWSRMVIVLAAPMRIVSAGLDTTAEDGSAVAAITLAPTSDAAFAAAAGVPDSALFQSRGGRVSLPEKITRDSHTGLRVVIDPGHGGIDPGAEAGDLTEAGLMLAIARELKELLLRSEGIEVILTREEDEFVPLDARITRARDARADLFLSLHADALPQEAGKASGATVYTLSDRGTDTASQRLAERHNRDDLLSGVDLSTQSDEIAIILMNIVRTETMPRAERFADTLVSSLRASGAKLNSRPRRGAGFAVLRAADVPSVLLELGFLSSARDRDRLTSPDWRRKYTIGIRDAILAWAAEDAAQARLLRK